MNTNFDKQRFVKCLKHRLTDRFMITYSILALVCCLPMIAVVFATGSTSFLLMLSCVYTMLFGVVLAANKHFDTLLPATAFEKFASYCTALVIYMTAINFCGCGLGNACVGCHGNAAQPRFPNYPFRFSLDGRFRVNAD